MGTHQSQDSNCHRCSGPRLCPIQIHSICIASSLFPPLLVLCFLPVVAQQLHLPFLLRAPLQTTFDTLLASSSGHTNSSLPVECIQCGGASDFTRSPYQSWLAIKLAATFRIFCSLSRYDPDTPPQPIPLPPHMHRHQLLLCTQFRDINNLESTGGFIIGSHHSRPYIHFYSPRLLHDISIDEAADDKICIFGCVLYLICLQCQLKWT